MRKITQKKSFDDCIDEYLCYCRSRRLRPKTMQSYEQTLRLFERWALERERITMPSEVTGPIVRSYINDLQERGKYSFYADGSRASLNCPERRRDYRQPVSITTINNYIRNLRAFFNWYCEDLPPQKNPMRKITQIKCERTRREYLEDDELNRLLNSFDKSYFAEHRDRMVILLMLDTGMRLGECLRLSIDHIDPFERTISIPASLTKSGKGRSVFFSLKTAKALQQWFRFKDRYIETTYLFPVKTSGLPLEISTFETNFRKYITRSGIEKKVSPHCLRNNFAKRCIMAGMDIYTLSRILGHSSVTVTEKAYLDLTDQDIRHCYQNFSPVEHLNR